MKFSMLIALVMFAGVNAQAFQTPLQQSAGAVKAIVQSLVESQTLETLSIKKIALGPVEGAMGAKVELLDQEGQCLAIPYILTADKLGRVKAKPNPAALAICD